MKRTSATGSTGRMISVSGKFVKANTVSEPIRRTIDCTASNIPWPINILSFSTSSVARIINWPVRLRS